MLIDDPVVLKDRLATHAERRAGSPARLPPGPAAFRMLRVLGGIFTTQARWRAFGVLFVDVISTVAQVLLILRLATWNADFFDALEQKSMPGLVTQTWLFLPIMLGLMVVQTVGFEARRRLQIDLRTYLTRTVSDAWMADGRHYRLRSLGAIYDNEDGRIAEDARVVCEMVVDFLSSLFYASLQLVLFVGVLWFTSGPLVLSIGGTTVTLPGHMVWVALLYAGTGAAITVVVGHPLVRSTERRQAAEADYRGRLRKAITHSPTIALTRAEGGERRGLAAAFDVVRRTWTVQTSSFRNLIFLGSGYTQLTIVLPLLLLAPRNFSGEMSLGTLMQVTIAFGQVTAALSWVSYNYPSVAQWEASAERVLTLHNAVVDLAEGDGGEEPDWFRRGPENGPNLAFRDLTLISPTGEVLLADFSAEIRPGERVLIEASPQVAAALFRATGGLSPWGAGRIELPETELPFFLGDRPYLPDAPLAEILAEPNEPTRFAEDELANALTDAGLAHLVPLLGTAAAWEQDLGIEDQHRLGFARALLHRPHWIVMHEATSGLDAETEDRLMDLLTSRLPGTTLVMISHRAVMAQRFQRRIAIGAPPSEGASRP